MAKSARSRQGGSLKPDLASLTGLIIAVGGILGGLTLEGGKVTDVAQITAAMIVLGGTFGAVLVTTPSDVLRRAFKRLGMVFFDRSHDPDDLIDELISYAAKARKHGLVALETDADRAPDRFLRKALSHAVDGSEMQELRKMMELEIAVEEQRGEAEARVYEVAGGYAPTIGIIGAVLGLIQVMKHLQNIEEVGKGIAVAFVATVYGVGLANVVLLPAANKIRARIRRTVEMRELMLEGVVGIAEGLNPKLIRAKLEAYTESGSEPPPRSRRHEAAA